MSIRRKYKNPPIQEAVCELHFEPPLKGFDREEYSPFKELWRKEYPGQRIVKEQQFHFNVLPDAIEQKKTDLGSRLICSSSDGCRLVQLSGKFLAVNQLPPYPGWEESFRDDILKRCKEFCQASGVVSFTRIGLRYINKIQIPIQGFVWEDWFQFSLPVVRADSERIDSFQMMFRNSTAIGQYYSTTIAGNPADDMKSFRVLLDLDAVTESTAGVSLKKISRALEVVHRPHNEVFEKYLTDRLRQLFD